MSNTETEKKESTATSSSVAEKKEKKSEPVSSKAIRNIPIGKPGPKCRKILEDPTKGKKLSDTPEKGSDGTNSSNSQQSTKNDLPGELRQMFGNLASSPTKKGSADDKSSAKVTTENLLSVLEDETEKKVADEKSSAPNSITMPVKNSENELPDKKNETAKPSSKRYVYKLKAKSGKVLRYTSNTPIVLKKPVISLTKMVEAEEPIKGDNETDDVDSDNSTKENMKDNEASGEPVTWTAKKRGRPPLSQKTPSAVVVEDRNSSDAGDKDRTPAFGMQTRKRQLRFLPDGRLVTPNKKSKTDDKKGDTESASSSDSDIQTASDDESDQPSKKSSSVKKGSPEKKPPVEKKTVGKAKKVFDFENYFREKTGYSPTKEIRDSADKSLSATPQNKTSEGAKSKSVTESTPQQSSPAAPKKITPVDPAQLLSSLIGVPITPSQLNIVKFKPRIIQERSSTGPAPKKVTIDEDKFKKIVPANDAFRNSPFKVVSKTTFQKILPKPSPMPDKTPIIRKVMEHRILPTSMPATYTAIAPKIAPEFVMNDTLSKFDNFSDSKVVKTKGGPKKVLKRKSIEDDSQKTVYDLLQHVFDQMPSWNLHVIPDTNHFCIAQVSRGRMGIPILKKSIELNSEFFAKVYVHQLHCKRYDGVYDTESKILSLIREIDALAA